MSHLTRCSSSMASGTTSSERPGSLIPNSGGNTVYLSPGLRLTVDNWSGYLSAGVPIVKEVNGIQPPPTWRVIGGIAMSFGPLIGHSAWSVTQTKPSISWQVAFNSFSAFHWH